MIRCQGAELKKTEMGPLHPNLGQEYLSLFIRDQRLGTTSRLLTTADSTLAELLANYG